MNYNNLINKIIGFIGGEENIASYTNCMTRLRITTKNQDKVDLASIKSLDEVLGVVPGDQIMIVLGPGHAQRAREAMDEIVSISGSDVVDENDYNLKDIAQSTKSKIKGKQTSNWQAMFKKIGNIFMPILPAWIACGLIGGIVNIMKNANPDLFNTYAWLALLASSAKLISVVLNYIVGWNASKEFGGTPIMGAVAAALMGDSALNGILASASSTGEAIPLTIPFTNYQMSSGLGGILGIIFAAYIFAKIERFVRKYVHSSIELFVVPLVTLIVGGLISIIVVQPIAGLIMKFITYLLVDIALLKGGVIGGYALAALFLPLVMLGIHRGLTAVHADLITATGHTVLLPILAMAGCGQVGMAIAILLKTKDKKLKKVISSSLPVGILGIGEPLIYGVSLPLGKPFITACLGGGFGGAVIAFATKYIADVGAISPTTSGLVLTMLIDNNMWVWYLAGVLAAYVGGFLLTYFFGFDDSLLSRLGNSNNA